MNKFLTLLLLLFTASAIACNSTENANNANHAAATNHNGNANTKASSGPGDGWITVKTKLALIADKRTSGFETNVDTKDGVVTLSGKVDTTEAKTAANEVARGIDGVKSVDNQLQVVPEAKRKEVNAADDKIRSTEGMRRSAESSAIVEG